MISSTALALALTEDKERWVLPGRDRLGAERGAEKRCERQHCMHHSLVCRFGQIRAVQLRASALREAEHVGTCDFCAGEDFRLLRLPVAGTARSTTPA